MSDVQAADGPLVVTTSLRAATPEAMFGRMLLAASACGIAVAAAPAIPWSLARLLLVATMTLWLIATVTAVGHVAVSLARNWGALGRDAVPVTVGLCGVAVAVLSSCQLGIMRIATGRPHLTWSVDWRYHLDLSQAVARKGGLDEALAYAGAPIRYHVGPAWLAGATQDVVGHGIAFVSYLVIPFCAVVTIAAGLLLLLRSANVPRAAAALASGVVLTIPALGLEPEAVLSTGSEVSALYRADTWIAGAGFMLSSFFGMAVVVAGLALVCQRRPMGLVVGAVAIGAAAGSKPQFAYAALALLAVFAAPQATGWLRHRSRRSLDLVLATCVATASAAVSTLLLSEEQFFASPRLRPFATGEVPPVPLVGATVLALGALTLSVRVARARGLPPVARFLALGLGSQLALWLLLELVQIPLRPELIARGRSVGMQLAAGTVQVDFAQMLILGHVLIGAFALAALASIGLRGRHLHRVAVITIGVASVLSPTAMLVDNAQHPRSGYEAVEDRELASALSTVPTSGTLLTTNDLSDAAEDYARALRAPLLTGYNGNRFYLSNIVHGFWAQPDSLQRLEEVRRFFGSAWSTWHEGWLRSRGITDVLVHDRCPPSWWEDRDLLPLDTTFESDHWWVLHVDATRFGAAGDEAGKPARARPVYGITPCLAMK